MNTYVICSLHGGIYHRNCGMCRAKHSSITRRQRANTPNAPLREGDTYLFWLRDEGRTLMATLYWDDGILRLQPINRGLPPIFKEPNEVDVRGRVLSVLRRMP